MPGDILHGDCVAEMQAMEAESVDAVVCEKEMT